MKGTGVKITEQSINIDRLDYAVNLFGSFDENIKILEKEYGVSIILRGSELKVSGETESVARACAAVSALLSLASKGETLNEQNVRYAISLSDEGNAGELTKLGGDCICITSKGKPIKPKTLGQQKYVEAIRRNTIVVSIGPAGTGKTYLAVAQAVAAALIEEVCDALQGEYSSFPRVSPGYGDFPLDAQKDILKMLETGTKIGLSMTEALMLVPTKSVTAIFAIKE